MRFRTTPLSGTSSQSRSSVRTCPTRQITSCLAIVARVSVIAWLAAGLALTLGLAHEARGATIFTTLGPGNSFDGVNGWGVQGSSVFGGLVKVASRFSFTGSNYTLTSADVAIYHFDGTNQANIAVYTDSSGLPGVPLSTTASIAAPSVNPGLVTANFGGATQLLANTNYWLVAEPGAASTELQWEFNDQNKVGVAFNQGGGWSNDSVNESPAFRINGTATVPEPSGVALIALIGTATLRRRYSASA